MQFNHPEKGPMNLYLSCVANEYNCSVKMVGRLKLHNADPKTGVSSVIYPDYQVVDFLDKNKDKIIKEFGAWMNSKEAWTALKDSNKIFPSDNGTYLPNYLLYADSVTNKAKEKYWQTFKGFIEEIEQNPKHGFLVFSLPMYSNNTYSASFWPSRVWGIVPPAMKERIIDKDNLSSYLRTQGAKATLSNLPDLDINEIKVALGKK